VHFSAVACPPVARLAVAFLQIETHALGNVGSRRRLGVRPRKQDGADRRDRQDDAAQESGYLRNHSNPSRATAGGTPWRPSYSRNVTSYPRPFSRATHFRLVMSIGITGSLRPCEMKIFGLPWTSAGVITPGENASTCPNVSPVMPND